MGGKDDVFLDCVRQALVQRITPPNSTKLNQTQFKSLIVVKTNRSFQAKKEENNKYGKTNHPSG